MARLGVEAARTTGLTALTSTVASASVMSLLNLCNVWSLPELGEIFSIAVSASDTSWLRRRNVTSRWRYTASLVLSGTESGETKDWTAATIVGRGHTCILHNPRAGTHWIRIHRKMASLPGHLLLVTS